MFCQEKYFKKENYFNFLNLLFLVYKGAKLYQNAIMNKNYLLKTVNL